MSRNQLSRTPEYFPHMKHRAAGRVAARQQAEELEQFVVAAKNLNQILKPIIDKALELGESFQRALQRMAIQPEPTQTDFALAGPSKEGTP